MFNPALTMVFFRALSDVVATMLDSACKLSSVASHFLEQVAASTEVTPETYYIGFRY